MMPSPARSCDTGSTHTSDETKATPVILRCTSRCDLGVDLGQPISPSLPLHPPCIEPEHDSVYIEGARVSKFEDSEDEPLSREESCYRSEGSGSEDPFGALCVMRAVLFFSDEYDLSGRLNMRLGARGANNIIPWKAGPLALFRCLCPRYDRNVQEKGWHLRLTRLTASDSPKG